ncbi:MAG: prepilin-type N-terminal cleavage/methylation domain-containing protein [Alcaligenaceae bacterium]|nr:MAG: prepilin-type N-terminal cleavage/methylation domain-containing protein [Alcaligenaceae bacterium]
MQTTDTAVRRLWNHYPVSPGQRGVTLIELMVGIAIGLLVIAVAMAALMVSRGVSGTVSDASAIQQQSSYLMRVIGMQLRQAGSLYLNPNPIEQAVTESSAMTAVAFETVAVSPSRGFDPVVDTLSAPSGALSIGYRRYKESVHTSATDQTIARNCLGGPTDDPTSPNSTDQRVDSVFQLVGTELRCQGNGGTAQPIAQNVANFQVRYLLQDNTVAINPTIKYVAAAGVTDWLKVQAVEVCIVLYGSEVIDMPADGTATYRDCDADRTPRDMVTRPGDQARRMHVAYRNIFQMRSQGLTKEQLLPL